MVELGRDGTWWHDGEELALRPGARAARTPTSSSRSCTGRSARTARSRACSSCSTCPTSASGVLASAAVHGQGGVQGADGAGRAAAGRLRAASRRGRERRRRSATSACRAGSSRRAWARRSASCASSARRSSTPRSTRRSRHDARVIVEATARAWRSSARCSGDTHDAAGPRAGRDRAAASRLVRLRGQVHRGRDGAVVPGADLRHGARAAARDWPRGAFRLAGCSGLARVGLLRRRRDGAAQRAQHDARARRRRGSTASCGRSRACRTRTWWTSSAGSRSRARARSATAALERGRLSHPGTRRPTVRTVADTEGDPPRWSAITMSRRGRRR